MESVQKDKQFLWRHIKKIGKLQHQVQLVIFQRKRKLKIQVRREEIKAQVIEHRI